MRWRYEQAVRTALGFHTLRPPFPLDPERRRPETTVIEFEGRRFVWHVIDPADDLWLPTVTTMVDDPADYAGEGLAMERLLSALSWWTRSAIQGEMSVCVGVEEEMEVPTLTARRARRVPTLFPAPQELVAPNDSALRRVLAYSRDGLNTGSPFFRFLAFYNALDIACEDHPGGFPAWFRAIMHGQPHPHRDPGPPPPDWWEYLQDERRHAVAHAVRDRPGPELDPDDPDDRMELGRDASLLVDLLQVRVTERWGSDPVRQRTPANLP